jgi:hypothetical protein
MSVNVLIIEIDKWKAIKDNLFVYRIYGQLNTALKSF